MKRLIFTSLFFIAATANLLAQKFESLVPANGGVQEGANYQSQLAMNSAGEVFVFGSFDTELAIGGDTIIATNQPYDDLFLIKLSVLGEYISMKHFGTNGNDDSHRIVIDGNDNIYVSWNSFPLTYFFDEDTTFTMTGDGAGLTCFDSDLVHKWSKSMIGTAELAASPDAPGVYVAAYYQLYHYDSDGNTVWQQSVNNLVVKSMTANDGMLAIACQNWSTVLTVDTVSIAGENIYSSSVFLLDTAGTAMWGRTIGMNNGAYEELPIGLGIQSTTHDVYVGLRECSGPIDFAGSTLFNPFGVNYSIAPVLKFDEDGNEMWGKFFYSETPNIGGYCMKMMENGEVLFGGDAYNYDGYFGDEVYDFGSGGVVAWLAKIDSDGNEAWVKNDPRHGYNSGVPTATHDVIGLLDGTYLASYTYNSGGADETLFTGCFNTLVLGLGTYFNRISNEVEPTPNTDFVAVMSGNLFTSEFPHQTEEQMIDINGAWNFADGSPWLYQDDVFHVFAEPGAYNVCLSMWNGCGSKTHCEVVSYRGLRAIEPYIGGQGGVVSALVLGGGFIDGTTFKLSRDGESDIVPELITYGNAATVFGRLNLDGAALGEWNVVAQIPGEDPDTLYNAFTVEVLRPAEVQVDILGPHGARLQMWAQKIVRVSNVGNEDAVLVPLHIELPMVLDMWLFAEGIDRHSVAGNEVINEAFDEAGGDFDVLTMTDSLYQIKRVNITIPFIGANSYVEYRLWLKGDVSTSQMTALAFPPLISSLALVDETVLPESSPFIQQFQETAEWVYEQDFNYDEIFPSYQEVIANYAQNIAQTPGGTGGWNIGEVNPNLPDIGGIGFVNFTPIISQPPSYSTTPIWIGPPIYGTTGPGTAAPVNPPPPPATTPPPPPPVSPSPEQCEFNGCCSPGCFNAVETIEVTDDQIIVELEDGTTVIIEIDEDNVEVTDEFDLSYEDYLEYLEETEGEGSYGNDGPDRPDYDNDDDEDFTFEIDEENAEVWDADDGEEGGGCMNCDNSSGEDDTDGGGSNGSEECDNCDGGPGGQGLGGGNGGGGEGGTGNGGGASGEDEDGGEDEDKDSFFIITGIDPNAIYGPERNGDIYLNNVRDHSYTITFENLAEATAPAQTVVVTDTLDTEKFDVHSLRFVNATVADSLLINMEPGVWNANYMVNLMEDLYLNVTTQFDTTTGIIRWEFNSVDPLTMSLTQNPLAGFLPPNVNGTEGTGSLSYVVNFSSATLDGDVIDNRAEIVFDLNEAIITNTHTNILDFTAPESEVEELPASSENEFITLQLDGSDNISGIAYYHVFVSINNHPYALYKTTAHNEIPFRGIVGRTYKFFSMATDKAGNIEAAPADPLYDYDTQISFVTSVDEIVLSSALKVFPNPTVEDVFLTFTLTQHAEMSLNLMNVLGENISLNTSVVAKNFSAGMHTVQLSIAHLPAGVYVLEMKAGDESVMKKVVKE